MTKSYKLYHYTSLDNAINIMDSKQFIPANCYGDKGLNCFIDGVNYTQYNSIDHTGVKMTFIWKGRIQKIESSDTRDLYPENILIDQGPWRAHIAGPVSDSALRLVSMDIDEKELDTYLQNKFVYKYFYPTSGLKKLYRKKFCTSLKKRLADNPIFISIKSFR